LKLKQRVKRTHTFVYREEDEDEEENVTKIFSSSFLLFSTQILIRGTNFA